MTDATTPEQPRTAAEQVHALLAAIDNYEREFKPSEAWAQMILDRLTDRGYALIEAQARPAVASDGLRAALMQEQHYDPTRDPNRPIEMSAREWRDAYFALARIALKELEECRAALASEKVSDG